MWRQAYCLYFVYSGSTWAALIERLYCFAMFRVGVHCWEAADYETPLCSSNPTIPPIRHHYHGKTLPPHDLQRARSGWVNLGEHTLGLNLWRLLAIEELLSDCVQLALLIQNEHTQHKMFLPFFFYLINEKWRFLTHLSLDLRIIKQFGRFLSAGAHIGCIVNWFVYLLP